MSRRCSSPTHVGWWEPSGRGCPAFGQWRHARDRRDGRVHGRRAGAVGAFPAHPRNADERRGPNRRPGGGRLRAERRARYPDIPSIRSGTLAAVPIGGHHDGRVIGALGFRFGEVPLYEADRAVLMTMGQLCGHALDRARLYEVGESERRRLQTLMRELPVGVAIAEAPSGDIIAVNREGNGHLADTAAPGRPSDRRERVTWRSIPTARGLPRPTGRSSGASPPARWSRRRTSRWSSAMGRGAG